jgi:hypothetical protein
VTFCTTLLADPQSKAFSQWHFNTHSATLVYTIAGSELARIKDSQLQTDKSELLITHLQHTVGVAQQGQDCTVGQPESLRAKPGFARVQIRFDCPVALDTVTISIRSMFTYSPSHVHFAKFKLPNRPVFEHLYTSRSPAYTLELHAGNSANRSTIDASWSVFTSYVLLGFEHILLGIDHIAFLLTLLLLAHRLRDLLLLVTGFTLGHSITLSLAVLQLVTPDIMVVEALIGFTIALVAAQNIAVGTGTSPQLAVVSALLCAGLAMAAALSHRGPPVVSLLGLALFCLCYLRLGTSAQQVLRWRPALSILFGLIHGFGFASVLMEVGLPQQRLLPALLGFNIGVEIGQVAIVAALVALGLLLKRQLRPGSIVLGRQLLSAALCGVGVFWMVQRSF